MNGSNWLRVFSWSLLGIALSILIGGCGEAPTVAPFPPEQIELTHAQDGETFYLAADGNVYREVEGGKRWSFHETVYNPEDFRSSYREIDGRVVRCDPESDRQIEVRTAFQESFEDLSVGLEGLRTLVSEPRRLWGSFTIQTPAAPEVSDYVDLRNGILRGEADFIDGSIRVTEEQASVGRVALRFETPACPSGMVTCKASLSSPLLYFRNGEDLWYEADYWFEEGLPLTIADFECEFVYQHPGIRIRLYDNGVLGAELKALDKPQYRQAQGREIEVPRRKWVNIRTHLHLSPTDGLIEIWQDGQQVLKASGPTLPFRSAIYNSLEVGISAHSTDESRCVLFVDNLKVAAGESSVPNE